MSFFFQKKSGDDSFSAYKSFLGESANSRPATAPISYSDEFETVANAIAACRSIISGRDPQDLIDSLNLHGQVHSLVYASRLHHSIFDARSLSWTACATASDDSGFRTWFISFNAPFNFKSSLENIETVKCAEFHDIGYSKREYVQSGFDPSFILPWLGKPSGHRVVFCGYSMGGGAVAQLEFCRVRRNQSIEGEALVSSGRLKCITFGCPLIGQAHFARRCKPSSGASVLHFVHENDLVPSILATIVNTAVAASKVALKRSSGGASSEAVAYDHTQLLDALDSPKGSGPSLVDLIKRIPVEPLMQLRNPTLLPFVCASGSVVRIQETEVGVEVVLCTQEQIGEVYGSVLNKLTAEQERLVRHRSFDSLYAQPLLRCFGRCLQPGIRWIPEPNLIAPTLSLDLCQVTKSPYGNTFKVVIGGQNVHWLQHAHIHNMMMHESDRASQPTKLLSTSSPPEEVCIFSIQVRADAVASNADEYFAVSFYGVVGDPVVWHSGKKVPEISTLDDGMSLDEATVKRDGRFAQLEPAAVIDIAVLRMSFLLRTVASTKAVANILIGASDPMAVGSAFEILNEARVDGNLIERLRRSHEIFLYLLQSAHTDILLDAPEVLADIVEGDSQRSSSGSVTPNDNRLKKQRVGQIIDCLIETGLLIPDDYRVNSHMSHLTVSLRRFSHLARLRLLYLGSRAVPDISVPDSELDELTVGRRAALHACFQDTSTVRSNVQEFLSLHGAQMETVIAKPYDATNLMQNLTTECIDVRQEVKMENGRRRAKAPNQDISRSVMGLRALARTPFQDNSLVVQALHGRLLRSAVAGIRFMGSFFSFASNEDYDFEIATRAILDAWMKIDPQNDLSVPDRTVALQSRLLDDMIATTERGPEINSTVYQKTLSIVVEAIRSHISDERAAAEVGAGDIFSLECQLHKRVSGLGIMEKVLDYSPSASGGTSISQAELLADTATTETWPCFVKFLRASLQIHDLRLHLGSTYVICIAGTRGMGKSTLVKNVFGVDNVQCGASDWDSTAEVQSHYIPVSGEGAIKHLLVLDLPGSDDSIANSSLFVAEGFAVADLVIMVNKQERLATSGAVNLLKGFIHSIGDIDEAIPGKAKVRSWVDESEWEVAPSMDDDGPSRRLCKSVCKLVFFMTKADTPLSSIARDASEKGRAVGQQVHNLDAIDHDDGIISIVVGSTARSMATNAWGRLLATVEENLDKVAVANVCSLSDAEDWDKGANKGIVEKSIRAGAILDITGTVEFLARVVPLKVGAALRARREERMRQEREEASKCKGGEEQSTFGYQNSTSRNGNGIRGLCGFTRTDPNSNRSALSPISSRANLPIRHIPCSEPAPYYIQATAPTPIRSYDASHTHPFAATSLVCRPTSALHAVPVPTIKWDELRVGVVSGRCVVLGEGSFAKVLKGSWQRSQPGGRCGIPLPVALKVFKVIPGVGFSDIFQLARDEAIIMSQAYHDIADKDCIVFLHGIVSGLLPSSLQHIIPYLVGDADKYIALVMRYEAGGTLEALLFPPSETVATTMDMKERVRIGAALAKSIAELHSVGIVHGDLTPSNVLLSEHNPPMIRLTDFGLSIIKSVEQMQRSMGASSMGTTYRPKGTPLYAAPELLQYFLDLKDNPTITMAVQASRSSDIYSLSILLFELFSRKKPFPPHLTDKTALAEYVVTRNGRPPLDDLPTNTPEPIRDILKSCWDIDRRKRLSAVEVYSRLDQIHSALSSEKFDMFFSHPWADKKLLSHVYAMLTRKGYRVWYDQDEMGWDLERSMREGVANSKVVLACVNERYQKSANCMLELRAATASASSKPVVSLVIQSEPFMWASQELKDLCAFPSLMFVDIGSDAAKDWSSDVVSVEQIANLAQMLEPLLKIFADMDVLPSFPSLVRVEEEEKSRFHSFASCYGCALISTKEETTASVADSLQNTNSIDHDIDGARRSGIRGCDKIPISGLCTISLPFYSLSVEQVCSLLAQVGLGSLREAFERERVDGEMLGQVESAADLEELGIDISPQEFTELSSHVLYWCLNGVSTTLLSS